MGRLTTRNEEGIAIIRLYTDPADAKGLIEESARKNCEAIEKLARYEDLEEQGRLIELLCAVGDTVYEPRSDRGNIQEYTVISVHISKCNTLYGWELKDGKGIYSNVNGFTDYAIGRSIFLTKEEAIAAWNRREGEK